jgi:CDP-diglyceride synthetase
MSRLAVAIPGIAIAIVVVAVVGALFAIVMAALAALGLYELYNLTAAQRPLRWAGYAGAILTVLLAWGYDPDERGVVLGLALSLILVAIAGLILPRRDDITARMATTFLGVVYLGVPLAALVLTRGSRGGRRREHPGGRLGLRPPRPGRAHVGRDADRARVAGKTVEGAVISLLARTAVWIAASYMDWITGWESLRWAS